MKEHHAGWVLVIAMAVIAISIFGIYFGAVPSYIGKIVAEAGNVTRLNVDWTATYWDGIYGKLTTASTDSNYTAGGGAVAPVNISVANVSYFLDPNKYVFASTQAYLNISLLVPADPSELDAYLGLPSDNIRSATLTFLNQSNFTVGNKNFTLFMTYTNSPVEGYDLALMKDNNSGAIFLISHIKPGGTAYNGDSADFQMMLPVPAGQTPTYNIFMDSKILPFQITLYVGQNWFSYPLAPVNNTVSEVLRSIGYSAGIDHEYWSGAPGCTGDSADNYVGNYTVIWTYNASDVADPWKDYNPRKPCHQIPLQQIQYIRSKSNYQIDIIAQDILDVTGAPNGPANIFLVTGTNWIGYPTMVSRNVSLALESIGKSAGTEHESWSGAPGCTGDSADNYVGNYTVIWTYNATDITDPWKDFNPTKPCHQMPLQQVQMLRPGSGYQITMIADDTLIINW